MTQNHPRHIFGARDGVRWNLVDQKGVLDFRSALPLVEAAEAEGAAVIWDLYHYGSPDDLDPFCEHFVERFCRYCEAFARLLVQRGHGERGTAPAGARFYTPINEISFSASEMSEKEKHVVVDAAYVQKMLADIVKDQDLSRYIL